MMPGTVRYCTLVAGGLTAVVMGLVWLQSSAAWAGGLTVAALLAVVLGIWLPQS